MSAWFMAVGWLWIANGAFTMWRDSRLLASRPYRRGELSRAGRAARRKALTSLRYSLFFIASGVAWVAGWYTHPIIAWLAVGYLVVLVAYDLSVWSRSRNRRKSGGQTAELS
jgi:Flp pilus assembly protein TadB